MNYPPRILIAAMSSNHVIGTDDGMPWEVPEEYKQYLDFIRGNTVIMGRKTYEIFGKDLTSDHVMVISRSWTSGHLYQVMDSLHAAIDAATQIGRPIFIAGGASIYEQAMPIADAMYLSEIKGQYEGTAYFPSFDPAAWRLTEIREAERFTFRKWQRRDR